MPILKEIGKFYFLRKPMKIFIFICLIGFEILQAQVPVAPPPPTVVQKDVRNQVAFATLNWYIGTSLLPNILVGYRDTTTEVNNNVKGGSISISYNTKENTLDQFKVIGIAGNTDIVGEAGVGYSLYQQQFFANVGIQGLYMDAGLDYSLNNKLGYYIGVTTVDD